MQISLISMRPLPWKCYHVVVTGTAKSTTNYYCVFNAPLSHDNTTPRCHLIAGIYGSFSGRLQTMDSLPCSQAPLQGLSRLIILFDRQPATIKCFFRPATRHGLDYNRHPQRLNSFRPAPATVSIVLSTGTRNG